MVDAGEAHCVLTWRTDRSEWKITFTLQEISLIESKKNHQSQLGAYLQISQPKKSNFSKMYVLLQSIENLSSISAPHDVTCSRPFWKAQLSPFLYTLQVVLRRLARGLTSCDVQPPNCPHMKTTARVWLLTILKSSKSKSIIKVKMSWSATSLSQPKSQVD